MTHSYFLFVSTLLISSTFCPWTLLNHNLTYLERFHNNYTQVATIITNLDKVFIIYLFRVLTESQSVIRIMDVTLIVNKDLHED